MRALQHENGLLYCSIHQYEQGEWPCTGGRLEKIQNLEDGGMRHHAAAAPSGTMVAHYGAPWRPSHCR